MTNPDEGKPTNPKDSLGVSRAPMSPLPAAPLAEVGVAMLFGALKYGRHNWRDAGVRSSVYYDAALRHLFAWWEGEETAADSGVHHLAHAIAGLLILRDASMRKGLPGELVDDRPPATPTGWLAELNDRAAALRAMFDNMPPPQLPGPQLPGEPLTRRVLGRLPDGTSCPECVGVGRTWRRDSAGNDQWVPCNGCGK